MSLITLRLAITGYGLHKRVAECESAAGYGWERARSDRVHLKWRRAVGMSRLYVTVFCT